MHAGIAWHSWTSLAINVDNLTAPHVDRHNGTTSSFLLGLSHHVGGELWIADPQGTDFQEMENVFQAGRRHHVSATGVFFDGRQVPHATCPWTEGNRVVLVAYTIRSADRLLPTAQFLEEIGFMLPQQAGSQRAEAVQPTES